MFNHSITTGYGDDAGTVQSVITKYQGSTEIGYDGGVAAGTTDEHLTLAWPVASMLTFMAYSDQSVTLQTNDAETPVQTLTLPGGVQLVWGTNQHGGPNPITADVTALYVTNAGTVDSKLKIR